MIDIKKLTKNDIGSWVYYEGYGFITECGRIKSFNKHSIFVVYRCNQKWNDFKNYTGVATNPEDLYFLASKLAKNLLLGRTCENCFNPYSECERFKIHLNKNQTCEKHIKVI